MFSDLLSCCLMFSGCSQLIAENLSHYLIRLSFVEMFSAFIRCSKMFSDDQKKFLDTLSTFSRYSVDVLFKFSRCSQDLLGLLVLGCWVGLVG